MWSIAGEKLFLFSRRHVWTRFSQHVCLNACGFVHAIHVRTCISGLGDLAGPPQHFKRCLDPGTCTLASGFRNELWAQDIQYRQDTAVMWQEPGELCIYEEFKHFNRKIYNNIDLLLYLSNLTDMAMGARPLVYTVISNTHYVSFETIIKCICSFFTDLQYRYHTYSYIHIHVRGELLNSSSNYFSLATSPSCAKTLLISRPTGQTGQRSKRGWTEGQ